MEIFLIAWISFAAAAFVVKVAQAVKELRPNGPAKPLFWATFVAVGVVACAAFGPFIFFSEVLGKGGE